MTAVTYAASVNPYSSATKYDSHDVACDGGSPSGNWGIVVMPTAPYGRGTRVCMDGTTTNEQTMK